MSVLVVFFLMLLSGKPTAQTPLHVQLANSAACQQSILGWEIAYSAISRKAAMLPRQPLVVRGWVFVLADSFAAVKINYGTKL